jgi:hypothetical protein
MSLSARIRHVHFMLIWRLAGEDNMNLHARAALLFVALSFTTPALAYGAWQHAGK